MTNIRKGNKYIPLPLTLPPYIGIAGGGGTAEVTIGTVGGVGVTTLDDT